MFKRLTISLRKSLQRSNRRRLSRECRVPGVQQLEHRTLLAGNVLASLNGGSLILQGDNLANSVDVVVEDGDLIVRGRNNTLINGNTDAFTVAVGTSTLSDSFFARLGAGDDELFVEGVSIGSNIHIAGQTGNDRIGLADTTVNGHARITTSHGSDDIHIEGSSIRRNAAIVSGDGNDNVLIEESTLSGHVRIRSGRHDDAVVLDTVTVSGNAAINTWKGNDDVVLMDSTIGNRLHAITGRGNDFVMFDGTTVNRRTVIRSGQGADQLLTENGGGLGRLRVIAGRGSDAAQIDPATTTTGRRRVRGVDAGSISSAERDFQLNDADTGALTRTQAVSTFFQSLSNSGPLTIAVDTSANTAAVQSNDILATTDPNFELQVATRPGATVGVDSDGDGQFDDATATADSLGNATLNVMLTSNDTNNGENTLNIQATNGSAAPVTEQIDVHYSPGTIVRFDSSLGTWDVELFNDDAPQTVAAFLHDLSLNDDTIVHRNIDDFIIQGGGFGVTGTTVVDAPDFAAPPNEFDIASPANSNVRGTLSTAQTSNINSFSGGWFFNTVDNVAGGPAGSNNLDAVPHTVFGRVIGTGMSVVDQINNTPVFNVSSLLTNAGALSNAPLVNYTSGDVPTIDNFIRINSVTVVSRPPGSENTFTIPENSAAGTSVGTIMPATTDPVIFEFEDTSVAADLRLNADDHFDGNPAASVVLVEYISLQCPACAAAQPGVQQLLADNPDDVMVVRRHLPNDVSNGGGFQHSFEAALAAEAAGRQGQFNEMVDSLLSRQSEWTNTATAAEAQAVFESAATALGLNLSQFNSDMADQALTDRINRDIASAAALNASGTPSFFLNQDVSALTSSVPTNNDIQTIVQSLNRDFDLNRQTGEVTVRNASVLDFETNTSFTLDITATNGTTESITATVNVIDAFAG